MLSRVLAALAIVSSALEAESKADPSVLAPRPVAIVAISPGAARPATTSKFDIVGDNLAGGTRVEFEEKDIHAVVSSSSWTHLGGTIKVDRTARPGPRYFRVIGPRGASNLLLYRVTRWAVASEVDGGGDPAKATVVSIPTLISGHLTADLTGREAYGEEADFYRFHAAAGQRIEFNVLGARDWLRSDLSLTLMYPDGRQITSEEGVFCWDAYLAHTFDREGDYLAAVSITRATGSVYSEYDTAYYELAIGNAPLIWNVFPAGTQAGRDASLELRADFLPPHPVTELHSRGLAGAITSTEPGLYRLNLHAAPDSSLGLHAISFDDNSGILAPVPIVVGELPERVEREPNDTRAQAEHLPWPVTVNGRIDRKDDADWFAVEVKEGQDLVFFIEAETLGGSRLDSTLSLADSNGRLLQFADDNAEVGDASRPRGLHDAAMLYRFRAAGTYYVKVASLYRDFGPDQIYRLTIRPPKPDFAISLGTDHAQISKGETADLEISVTRTDGFECDLEISASGLPPGVSAEPLTIESGSANGKLHIRAASDAQVGLGPIEIIGTARIHGAEISHSAVPPGNPRMSAGPGFVDYHPAHALLSVNDPVQFALEPLAKTLYLVRGGTADMGVRIHRREGFDAPLQVSAENLPAGVDIVESEIVDEGKQARLRFRAAESAKPVRLSNLVVAAQGRSKGQQYSESAPPIALQID